MKLEHRHSGIVFAPSEGSEGGPGGVEGQRLEEFGQAPGVCDSGISNGESDVSGQSGTEYPTHLDRQQRLQQQIDLDRSFESLNKRRKDMIWCLLFERELKRAGLISRLEEEHILPIPQDTNPYDSETEESRYDQWWDEHPEDWDEFYELGQEREKILSILYVGAVLGHDFGDAIFPLLKPSDPSTE